MTAADEYLQRVARGMAGMDRRVRDDVLRELRSHLRDAAAEMDEARAVAAAESPEGVAARYKQMYGYGRAYQAVFIGVAAALAVFTLPLLFLANLSLNSASLAAVAVLVALIAYLMWIAVKAGSTVGLLAGLAACASRFASLAVLGALVGAVVPDATGWVSFTASSALLIALGFVPGAAKERWQRREASL